MFRFTRLAAIISLSLVCCGVQAQPWREKGGADGQADGRGPPHRLFISPSGEPFRQADGAAAWFAQADADHDGAITLAEFRADALRVFRIFDQNSDGVIDGFETAHYENEIAPEISQTFAERDRPRESAGWGGPEHGHGGDRGRGRGDRGGDKEGGGFPGGPGRAGAQREGAARFSYLDIPEPIRSADLNLDWRVTEAEWLKAADKRFAMLDVKSQGRLTPDSLPPIPGAHPPRGGPKGPPR